MIEISIVPTANNAHNTTHTHSTGEIANDLKCQDISWDLVNCSG